MAPPGGTAAVASNRTSAAVDRRAWKAARRAVVAQCDRCGVHTTATVNGRGRMTSVNVPAARVGGRGWEHKDCGGRFVAFDIEVGR